MICQKIISEHNGHILVESKQNVGTTFKINIPLVMNQIQSLSFLR